MALQSERAPPGRWPPVHQGLVQSRLQRDKDLSPAGTRGLTLDVCPSAGTPRLEQQRGFKVELAAQRAGKVTRQLPFDFCWSLWQRAGGGQALPAALHIEFTTKRWKLQEL